MSGDFRRRAEENANPTRATILELYAATTSALSAREVSEMLGLPFSQVSYHVRVLEAIGELRLVDMERRGGVTEFLYAYR